MIEVKNLTKKYGKFTAVKNISFVIEKGHVYGLLGPNGAGKSTTMNIITGCLAATEGSVTVGGYDIYENAVEAKKCIGYLPEIPPLYTDMTPVEYLKFVARAKKIAKENIDSEIDKVIKKTGIEDVSSRLIKNLSKGFRQRVGIAQAIIGDPEVIILDEPTVGLDPTQLIEVRELIKELGKDHAVVLSSHIMGEITAVCDYIIMIAHGRIVAEGTLEELEGSKNAATITVESRGECDKIKKELSEINGVSYLRVNESASCVKTVIEAKKGFDIREDVFAAFVRANAPILEMTSSTVGLEDLFIKIVAMPAPKDDADSPNETADKKNDEATIEPKNEQNTDNAKDPDDGYTPLFTDNDDTYERSESE